jgi:hypothetical protein
MYRIGKHYFNKQLRTMKTNEIILMLDQEANKLWEALQNAKLVFGEDGEATKLARARWVTAVDMLSLIKSKNK